MASVIPAIQAATSDLNVQRAMMVGSYMEGGWNSPFPVGDGGTSFGPFQIHLPAHPGVSAAQANDPTFAVNYMLPAYQNAVSKTGAINSGFAAATAAYKAERPAVMYPASRYNAAWAAIPNATTSATLTSATPSGGGNTGPITAPGLPGQDLVTWIVDWLTGGQTQVEAGHALAQAQEQAGPWGFLVEPITAIGGFAELLMRYMPNFFAKIFLPSTWVRIFAVMAGGILILIGLFLFFTESGTAKNAVHDVAGTAANAAMVIK